MVEDSKGVESEGRGRGGEYIEVSPNNNEVIKN